MNRAQWIVNNSDNVIFSKTVVKKSHKIRLSDDRGFFLCFYDTYKFVSKIYEFK